MDAGGSGAGGAFGAMGEATTAYYDRMDKYAQEAEQKRQFDEQQANAAKTAAQNQQQLDMQRYDRVSRGFDAQEADFAEKAAYLNDEDRAAWRNVIDAGRAGVQSYWATGKEDQFQAFNAQYGLDDQGKQKAWGTTVDGKPITYDSMLHNYFERKPIKDFEDAMQKTQTSSVAAFVSQVILDPTSKNANAADVVRSILDNKTTPAQAMAAIVANNAVEGFDSISRSLQKTGFTPAALATAEDALKLVDPKSFLDANGVALPQYTLIQKSIEQNRAQIDDYRKGVAITQGGQTIALYEGTMLTNKANSYSLDRVKEVNGNADLKDLGTTEDEGVVAVATSPAGKANYLRVTGGTEEDYNEWVGRTQANADIKKRIQGYNVNILGNQSLQATITGQSAQTIYDSIKPYIGQNAALDQMIKSATGGNALTEAQFTATILPQMLGLRNKTEMLGLLRGLTELPGGIGKAVLNGALDSGLVDQPTYDNLTGYGREVEGLRQKGVKVEDLKLDATGVSYQLSTLTSQALIDNGVPEMQAKGEYGKLAAGIATDLVTQFTKEGQQGQAFQVGADGQTTQLSAWAAQRAEAAVNEAFNLGKLPGATEAGRTAMVAAIQDSIAKSLQSRYTSAVTTGAMPYGQRVGATGAINTITTDAAGTATNRVTTAGQTAALPLAGQVVTSGQTAAIATAGSTTATGNYNTALIGGAAPYAPQIGAAQGAADLQTQRVNLATANQTLDIMPLATQATKQQYTAAISGNKYQDALNILKTQNIDLDYSLQQAGTMQALASMDPNADMAERITDPALNAMYKHAVNLANQQRKLTNDLATLKAQPKTGKGSGDPYHEEIAELGQTNGHLNSSINGIRASASYQAAKASLIDKYNATVAVDPVTGLYKVVIPATLDPDSKRLAGIAKDTIESFENNQVKPYQTQINANYARIQQLQKARVAGGLNPDGSAAKVKASDVAPPAFKQKSNLIAASAGIDPTGLLAFFGAESTYGTNVQGDGQHVGAGQISQIAQDQVNQTYGLKLDRNKPDDNMKIAAMYYKYISGVVGSTDPREIYAGYHDGPQTIANIKKANGGVLDWSKVSDEGVKGAGNVSKFYAANGGSGVGAGTPTYTDPARKGLTDKEGGVAYRPSANVTGLASSINSKEASAWAVQNPQVTAVDSDCAAIVSMYARSHGLNLPPSTTSAGLEQNAIKANWKPTAEAQTGDLVVWTGAAFGQQKSGGVGKHVGMVVGMDSNGKPLVLENPGKLDNGRQGITQVASMYESGSAKFYRAPGAAVGQPNAGGLPVPSAGPAAKVQPAYNVPNPAAGLPPAPISAQPAAGPRVAPTPTPIPGMAVITPVKGVTTKYNPQQLQYVASNPKFIAGVKATGKARETAAYDLAGQMLFDQGLIRTNRPTSADFAGTSLNPVTPAQRTLLNKTTDDILKMMGSATVPKAQGSGQKPGTTVPNQPVDAVPPSRLQNDMASDPAFQNLQSGVMSPAARKDGATKLAVQYLNRTNQLPGQVSSDGSHIYTATGIIPLPKVYQDKIAQTAQQITGFAQQKLAAQPAKPPAPLSQSAATQYMPSLSKLPGNTANLTSNMVGFVGTLKSMPNPDARSQAAVKYVTDLFNTIPGGNDEKMSATKKQVYDEIFLYFYGTGGGK